MAEPVHIMPYGNQLGILMDDGSTRLAYDTGRDIWVVTSATDNEPDPGSPGTPGLFIWPFNLNTISSEYGARDTGFHQGTDFAPGAGLPIHATAVGTVIVAGWHNNFGNHVIIHHGAKEGNHLYTLYAHMNNDPLVNPGNVVSQGKVIGYVGNTGRSYGAHLHYETHVTNSSNGVLSWSNPGSHINPRTFMATYNG